MSTADLAPDPEAADFAGEMLAADQTMRTILEETFESARQGTIRESGRTACGSARNVRHPIARFPESIELSSCPRGLVGVWHSHATVAELLNPHHSLPDFANVTFGHADISVVVGAQTAEALVGGADREQMADQFRAALGLDVEGTHDVVDALRSGQIEDPERARSRVRQAFDPLLHRAELEYADLMEAATATAGVPEIELATIPCAHSQFEHTVATDGDGAVTRAPQQLRERARSCGHTARQVAGGSNIDVTELAVANALGTIIGTITSKVVFGG